MPCFEFAAEPFDGSHQQVPRAQGQRQHGALLRDLPGGRAKVRQQEHHRRAGHAQTVAAGQRGGLVLRRLSRSWPSRSTQSRIPRPDDHHDDRADGHGGRAHRHPRSGEPRPFHLCGGASPRRGRQTASTAFSVGRGHCVSVDVDEGGLQLLRSESRHDDERRRREDGSIP